MTPSEHADDRLDREEFTIELQRLIARAQESGLEPGGAYNVRSPDPDVRDYTIEITEQEKLLSDGGVDSGPGDPPSPTGANGGGTKLEHQRRAVDRFLLAPIV